MTVQTETRTVSYTGNGSATSFAVPFLFYEDTELVVTRGGSALSLNVDYTVTGEGTVSGAVVFPVAPINGVAIAIERVVPFTQTSDLITQGNHSPALIERQLDELTFQTQQIADRVDDLEAGGSGGGAQDPVTLAAVGSSPNASAATLTGQQIQLQPASASYPGLMSSADFTKLANISGTHTGTATGTNTGDVTLGAFGGAPNASGASIAAQVLTLQPASATHPGGVSTGTQSIAGDKTFVDDVEVTGTLTRGGVAVVLTDGAQVVSDKQILGHYGAVQTMTSTGAPSEDVDLVLVDATAGAVTVQIPSAAGRSGRQWIIRKTDASANAVTLDPSGAETLNGAATQTLSAQYEQMEIASNGTAWFGTVTANHSAVTLGTFGSTPSAQGASLSAQILTLQPASATQPGGVSTTTQSFAGDKTWTGTKTTAGRIRGARSVSSSVTLATTDDLVFASTPGTSITIQLPTAVGITGKRYTVIKTDAASDTVVIDPNGAQTIGGASVRSLSAQYDSVTIESDGSNWLIESTTQPATGTRAGLVSTTAQTIAGRKTVTDGVVSALDSATEAALELVGSGTTVPQLAVKVDLGGTNGHARIYSSGAPNTPTFFLTLNAEYRTSPSNNWYADATASSRVFSFSPSGLLELLHGDGTAGSAITLTSGWTNATLLNSWVSFGSPYSTPGYRKLPDGTVELRGAVKNGSSGSAVIATLPAGFRPSEQIVFPGNSLVRCIFLLVETNGNVSAINSNTESVQTTEVVLNCVRFPTT